MQSCSSCSLYYCIHCTELSELAELTDELHDRIYCIVHCNTLYCMLLYYCIYWTSVMHVGLHCYVDVHQYTPCPECQSSLEQWVPDNSVTVVQYSVACSIPIVCDHPCPWLSIQHAVYSSVYCMLLSWWAAELHEPMSWTAAIYCILLHATEYCTTAYTAIH